MYVIPKNHGTSMVHEYLLGHFNSDQANYYSWSFLPRLSW